MASEFNSEIASSQAQPLPPPKDEVPSEEQDVVSQNSAFQETKTESRVGDMNTRGEKEKFERYFAEMTDYMTAKYFSDKTVFGGNIYDVKVTTDGQAVKASKFPPCESFADPANFLNLLNNVIKAEEGAAPESSNGKQFAGKKN